MEPHLFSVSHEVNIFHKDHFLHKFAVWQNIVATKGDKEVSTQKLCTLENTDVKKTGIVTR